MKEQQKKTTHNKSGKMSKDVRLPTENFSIQADAKEEYRKNEAHQEEHGGAVPQEKNYSMSRRY